MIRILVDSTADFSLEELKARNIDMVPLNVNFGEESLQDIVELDVESFYERLIHGDVHPKTSLPSPAAFLEKFEAAQEAGDELICILLSGGLSGTAQSAQIAKELCDYENIYVVDSRQATAGIRALVDLACLLIKEGKSAEEIVAELEQARDRVRLYIMVDTLEYLHKGGRLSGAVNVVGTMLKVKPLLTLKDGVLGMVGKGMGTKDAQRGVLKLVGEQLNADPRLPVYFVYSAKESNCVQLRALAEEKYGISCAESHSVGAVLGTHVGPGAAAIAYLEAK